MIQGRWPTCGTAATGEILRFDGWSCLSSSHGMTLQKSSSPLVFNVFFKQGYCLGGACRWVRSSRDGCLYDVPGPVGAAIHLNSMPPLFQGRRERVHVGQRLRLHE
jgi:hypothetical protein